MLSLAKRAFVLGAVLLTCSMSSAAAQECVGDCDDSGSVGVSELIRCVRIALDLAPVDSCSECDANGDGTVRIPELITAVSHALCDCQTCAPMATRTPTNTQPAATPTPTQRPVTAQDGAVLFGDQCVDCHDKSGSDIDDPAAAAIKAAIANPATGMDIFAGLFSDAQIDALSRYLTLGEHSANWQRPTNHGSFASTAGVSACQVCHGGPALTGDGRALSCYTCHDKTW
jgi:hypothetical protein